MKGAIFILFTLLAGFGFCKALVENVDINFLKTHLADTIFSQFVKQLESQFQPESEVKDLRVTMIPPIADPAFLPATDYLVNMTWFFEGKPIKVEGFFNRTYESVVTGFSGLINDFEIITPPLRPIELDINIRLPYFEIVGEYFMNQTFASDDVVHRLTGSGYWASNFTNFFVTAHAITKTTGAYLGVASAVIDSGFSNLMLNGGEAYFDNVLFDWRHYSQRIQAYYDTLHDDAELHYQLNQWLTCALDHMINDCTAADLIAGDLECLKMEINSDCWEYFDPEPVTGTTDYITTFSPTPVSSTPRTSTSDPCSFNYGKMESEGLNNFLTWAFGNYGNYLKNNRLDPTPPIITAANLEIDSAFLRLDGLFRNTVGSGISNFLVIESIHSDFLAPQLNFQVRLTNVSLHGLYNASGSIISMYPISGEGSWDIVNFSLDIYVSIYGFAIEEGFININNYAQREIGLQHDVVSSSQVFLPHLVTPESADGLGVEVLNVLGEAIPRALQDQGRHPIIKSLMDYLTFVFSVTPLSEIIGTTKPPCIV